MHDPEAHPRILRWEWALSSLNLKHTSFMNPEEKLFLKMEEVAGKSLIPGLLIPVLKDRKVEPDVYRMAQSILQLLRKDEELFRAKFETCFPEQSFISYRGKLYDSYAFLELSPDPTIFEIPLLAEAYQLKVSYYVIDEQGNVRIEHIGPEHAPPHSSLMLAKHTQYPRIQYILSAE
jgi:hypothetical protein